MSTKWSTQILGKSAPNFGELLKDEFTVVLLRGKNVFGDMIYCYVQLAFPDLERLQQALKSDASFNPSDYGTVVAAGKGEPTEQVKAEMALAYPSLSAASTQPTTNAPASAAPIPEDKKKWDEY